MTEKQTCKFVATLVEHQKLFEGLSVEDAQWCIQNPQVAIERMCHMLGGISISSQLSPVVDTGVLVRYRLKVWKTIRVGGVSRDELFAQVDRITPIGGHTQVLVRRPDFSVAATKRDVNLVVMSLKDLGFTEPPSSDEVLSSDWLNDWSLKNLSGQVIRLCDAEVAPHLFLQLLTDERKLDLWVAMVPIPGEVGQASSILGVSPDCGVHIFKLRPGIRLKLNMKLVFELQELPTQPTVSAAPAP